MGWSGDEKAFPSVEVSLDLVYVPSAGSEQRPDLPGLAVAKFHGDTATRAKSGPEFLSKAAIECEAVPPAVERLNRIMIPDFRFESGNVPGGNIRRIRDDQVEGSVGRHGGAAVALEKEDPIRAEPEPFGIAPGQGEGHERKIDGGDSGGRDVMGDGQGKAAGAGAPVQYFDGRFPRPGRPVEKPGPSPFGEKLRFGPGNESFGANPHFEPAKRNRPENMLQGNALTPLPDGLANHRELGVVQLALELEVEAESGKLKNVRQDKFDLKARRFHAALREEGGAALDDVEQPHAGQVALAGAGSQT